MKPQTEHPLSSSARAAIELIRSALAVVAKLPANEQHLVREQLAHHLLELGACGHPLDAEDRLSLD